MRTFRLPRPRKRHLRLATRKLHLWMAFAAGAVLLVVMVSGAILVLDPEIDQVFSPERYDVTETGEEISPGAALAAVRRDDPEFDPSTVIRNRNVYVVADVDFENEAYVDPGTGEVLGTHDPNAGFMGFVKNLHMCGLTCKEYPGYIAALKERVPFLGKELMIGGIVLGLTGLVLLFMAISGLVLWWPGVKRFARGFRIRRGKGGYSKNYDLHKVFGFAALPFLAMWAITGMGFEFKQIEQAWYAVMPGERPSGNEEFLKFQSKPGSGEGISPAEAERIAVAEVPGSEPVSISVPAKDDRRGYYDVYVAKSIDSYEHYEWPGTHEVAVDRYSGRAKVVFPVADRPIGQEIWEDWNFTVHAGTPVGWIPRLAWVFFGLVPLLLAFTGTAMWLLKRRMRKRRGRRKDDAKPQIQMPADPEFEEAGDEQDAEDAEPVKTPA